MLEEFSWQGKDAISHQYMHATDSHHCLQFLPHYSQIIVNRKTAIDVETMESIARDSYHLRMSCTYDWRYSIMKC